MSPHSTRKLDYDEIIRIHNCVVRVVQGDSTGSGFFALPGFVVSAGHIYSPEVDAPLKVYWNNTELIVSEIKSHSLAPDLLVIELEIKDHPVLTIKASAHGSFEYYSFGYQLEDRGYNGYPAGGNVNGITHLADATGAKLLVLSTGVISPGLSGAPLYSIDERYVVGVVKRSNPDGGGYAVPIVDLSAVCPTVFERALVQDAETAIAAHKRLLLSQHSFVSFAGLDKQLPLDDIYTTLTIAATSSEGSTQLIGTGGTTKQLRGGTPSTDGWKDMGQVHPRFQGPVVPLHDLLSSRNAVVLGEPGVGKTTLLRHIAGRVCRGELFQDCVPIFIRLNSLASDGNIFDYIEAEHTLLAREVGSINDSGLGIYLLDGLDEVRPALQRRIAADISTLIASGNRVYMTCRKSTFPRSLLSGSLNIYECIGFNRHQRARFIRKWHSDDPQRGRQLEDRVNKFRGLRKFGENPLMLSMLSVCDNRYMTFSPGRNRVQTYQDIVDELYERRSGTDPQLTVSKWMRNLFLEWVGYELSIGGKASIREHELPRFWSRFKAAVGLELYEDAAFDSLLRWIVEMDGLIEVGGDRQYRFVHPTFQEYFASLGFLAWGTVQEIAERARDSRWEEVVRLCCGQLSAKDLDQVIGDLLDTYDSSGEAWPLIISAKCAAESVDQPNEYTDRIISALLGDQHDSWTRVEVDRSLAMMCASFDAYVDVARSSIVGAENGPVEASRLREYLDFLGLVGTVSAGDRLLSWIDRLRNSERGDEASILCLLGAIGALGQCLAESCAPVLSGLLRHWSDSVAAAAAAALHAIGVEPDPPTSLLGRPMQRDVVLHAPFRVKSRDSAAVRRYLREIFLESPDSTAQISVGPFIDPEWVEGDSAFYDEILNNAGSVSKGTWLSIPGLWPYVSSSELVLEVVRSRTAGLRERAAGIEVLCQRYPAVSADIVVELCVDDQRDLALCGLASLAQAGNSLAHSRLFDLVGSLDWLRDPCLRLVEAVPTRECIPWLRTQAKVRAADTAFGVRVRLVLARLKDPMVIREFESLLNANVSASFRTCSYEALARLNSRQAFEVALTALEREPDRAVISRAIGAIGTMDSDGTESVLLRMLQPEMWPAAWPALMGPLRRGEQRANDTRQVSAIIALGRVGSVDSIKVLSRVASDPQQRPDLVRSARASIEEIRGRAVADSRLS